MTTTAKKKTKRKPKKSILPKSKTLWKEIHYVTIYQLACDGMTDRAISKALDVTVATFSRWKRRRPAIAEALKRARSEMGDKTTGLNIIEYIYKRLPEDLQIIWDEMAKFEQEKNGIRKLETLLVDSGKKARQHLFCHALIGANFNISEACRKVNIPRSTVDGWVRNEFGFGALMDEMDKHAKEFCKGSYFQLVGYLEPSIVLHSARTINREYFGDEKLKVDHSGEVNVSVDHRATIAELDLDAETLEKLVEAIRKQKKTVIEAESKLLN